MTPAQKAALEWLEKMADGAGIDWSVDFNDAIHARTLKAMLAEPRLPAEPTPEMTGVICDVLAEHFVERPRSPMAVKAYRALYAHLTRPHVDYNALDEARMDDSSDAGASPRPSTAEKAALRKAISVLRGWSAEAAGRTGLAESVLIVCNAAESTLPLQMYRIRGRNFEIVRAGPISISEVENDQ